MDFVFDVLFDGRRLRALTLLDVHTRDALAIEVDQGIKEEQVFVVVLSGAVDPAQLRQIAGTEPEIAAKLEDFAQGWCQRHIEILAIGRAQGVFRADLAPLPAALALTGALTAFAPRGPGGLAMFWPVFDEIERGFLAFGRPQEEGQ